MNYFWVAISGIVLSLIFTVLARRFFPRWGLLDKPHKYGLNRAPIPYFGGVTIVLAFLIGAAIFLKWENRLLIFLGLALLVAMVSFLDDLKGISPYIRLLLQIGAGAALYFSGIQVMALPNPIGPEINLMSWQWGGVAVLSLLATIFWLLLIMNTLNWSDGLNGLASGVSAIASLVIFLLAVKPGIHLVDQTPVAVMALLLASILLVFAAQEFYPARILMGDTGSMFLGFMLAGLTIYSGGKLGTALLVLGFPILDALWVILRRILSKRSPLKGDLQHFHHRLLYAGLSQRQALVVIYLASAMFGLLALVLGSGQKIWAIIGLVATMAVIGLTVVVLEVEKSRKKA